MTEDTQSRLLGLFLVIAATACWSTSGIFINLIISNSSITPVGLAFWRDLGTFLFLFAAMVIFRRDLLKVKRRDLPWLIAMGALSIGLFHVLWNMSVTTIGASVSTVIQSNAPVIVSVLAWIIWKEPLTWRKILAIMLAAGGTVLISRVDRLGGASISLLGLLIALGAAFTYASFSLFGKKLRGSYSSWTTLVYVFGVASVVLFPFQIGTVPPWQTSPQVMLYFVGLLLLTTVAGFLLYTTALSQLQASVASITANTEVPFAAVLAYFFLGERLDVIQIIGAVLIISAVVLISLPAPASRRLQRQASLPN